MIDLLYNIGPASSVIPPLLHYLKGDMVPELTWLEQFRVTLEMLYYGNNDNNNIAVWELTGTSQVDFLKVGSKSGIY